MNARIGDANAAFSVTLVDQWIECGLRAAFVAPGSRSTPLAVALAERTEIRLEVFHDERSAGFAALGWGLATGTPAVVLCTSGTAATHFHAAVAEAGLSCVPMLVCTANRPPELWGVGAPQTIDQTDLYASSVRAFLRPGPPDEFEPSEARHIANQAWKSAASRRNPGPVHIDLSFREPLLGAARSIGRPLPPSDLDTPRVASADQISMVADRIMRAGAARAGVIVVGRGESSPAAIAELSASLGWPVIADHRSGLRNGTALRFHDHLLRHSHPFQNDTERILRFGEPLSSKALAGWIKAKAEDPVAVTGFEPWTRTINPELAVGNRLPEYGAAEALMNELRLRATEPVQGWRQRWSDADAHVLERLGPNLSDPTTEPGAAAAAIAAVPPGGALVVASSMPIRDVEWYGPDRSNITVYCNRGANGIDGVIATAIGVATAGAPTVCLVGDVAFLHDQSSLTALRRRSIDLTIAVIDNDGGGIFSMLPQHDRLDSETYELLFGTPHGTDIIALAQAHGISVTSYAGPAHLTPDGVRVAVVATNRETTNTLRKSFTTSRGGESRGAEGR
ncbi:MAG: 2-succinyl-5-enolpyruvyl-6-hydroxy-3-cyclohexene-1-carboxylic-acid synthase [Acidimicrobiales bacterium]